jgi:hypothetical protein
MPPGQQDVPGPEGSMEPQHVNLCNLHAPRACAIPSPLFLLCTADAAG